MYIVKLLLLLIVTNVSFAQTLPEFNKFEDKVFYNKMQNLITLNLNGADPSMIKLKMRNGQIGKLNDTSYQISYRGVLEDQVKIKLYYKNLPVDVYTMSAAQAPLVKISLPDTNKTSYTLNELAKQKLNVSIEDKNLVASGYKVHSFQVRAILPKQNRPFPIMSLNTTNLNKLTSARHKLTKGSKMIITDVRLVNKQKTHTMAQSNYFEILIK